jgi:CRISPR-associated protein Csb2
MLVVRVDLLHGTLRGAGHEDSTLTGTASAEWPPSPARLFQALVAADGTGRRCRVTGGTAGLDLLEEQPPPVVYAVPRRLAPASDIRPRFVPVDATAKDSTVQNYPARTAQLVRPGARVAPMLPVVGYCWPEIEPDPGEMAALRVRAARVGYLGAADSPVHVTVTDTRAGLPEQLAAWEPDDLGGDTALSVPFPGFLAALDAAFDNVSAGNPHRGSWSPRELQMYRDPDRPPAVDTDEPGEAIWLRFDRPIPGRKVLAVADTLRAATLQHADAVAGGPQRVPSVIHGHLHGARGGEHARFLPLPNAGYPHSDGRIHGACIWLPPGTADGDAEIARQAAGRIDRLVAPGYFHVDVSVFDGARPPWASNPARWTGPAHRWATVFPVVFERRVKRGLDLDELARWCEWAGLPRPVMFRQSRQPLLPGGVSLAPSETHRGDPRPYAHLEIEFADPVFGPVALGRGRHFGLGLMAPSHGHQGGQP